MINSNNFEEIRNTLVEVMNDPIAHQEALDECESLYQELFIGFGSEMSGKNLVKGREWNDSSLLPLLEERARYELDYENASVAASCSNLTIEEEFLKIVVSRQESEMNERQIKFHMDEYEHERYLESAYLDDEHSLLDWMSEQEIKDLYHNVCNSTYVCLVNYKGELESEALLCSVPHLRIFAAKYNYL